MTNTVFDIKTCSRFNIGSVNCIPYSYSFDNPSAHEIAGIIVKEYYLIITNVIRI